MIEARALCKRFGTVDAVRSVTFSARDGEITGLLGPNGAGKSTCLRMMYGVLKPDAGSACIDGVDIRGETSAARAHLGVLPHAAGLYGNLTARENIAYFGSLQGVDRQRLRERTALLSESLGMEGFLERRVKGFSQGQRIKVALARALKAQGRCILFSSHVMQEVAALCDRVVIIGHGRVLADEEPLSLRERCGAASLEEAFLQLLSGAEGQA
jgi:sodium transport system ATP-binding protein